MFYELIATVAAGFVGAGIALMIRRLLRRLPRWFVPIAAGGAMLTAAISLEYSWFGRTVDGLPEGVEVALTRQNKAAWRPWTYAYPFVDGFIAVDQQSALTHAAAPEKRMVDLLIFGRFTPPSRVRSVFDCANGRRADIIEGARLTDDGDVEGTGWVDTGPDHPVTRAACEVVS